MRRSVASGVVALAVAAAIGGAVAEAKSWPIATVCGQTRCMVVRHPTVDAFFEWWSAPFAQLSGPRPAAYYTVSWHDSDSMGTYATVLLYVPARHVMRIYESGIPGYPRSPIGPYWRTVPRSEWAPLGRIVGRLAPHRAPRHWPMPASS